MTLKQTSAALIGGIIMLDGSFFLNALSNLIKNSWTPEYPNRSQLKLMKLREKTWNSSSLSTAP